MTTNAGAQPGDRLVLTKAIGTGIISTAIKEGQVEATTIEAAIHSMSTLNRGAADVVKKLGIRTATDITGFGLLGHLRQMLRASGVSARLDWEAVPLLPGALELALNNRFPGGSLRNLADVLPDIQFPKGLEKGRRLLLADAQTSGGLLIATPDEALPELLRLLDGKTPVVAVIGSIEEGPASRIQVV